MSFSIYSKKAKKGLCKWKRLKDGLKKNKRLKDLLKKFPWETGKSENQILQIQMQRSLETRHDQTMSPRSVTHHNQLMCANLVTHHNRMISASRYKEYLRYLHLVLIQGLMHLKPRLKHHVIANANSKRLKRREDKKKESKSRIKF